MEKREISLTNRHVSLLLSFFIISSFFIFISGYFFGKKKAVEEFHGKAERESLADHVYYSVCTNYGNYDRKQEQESTEDASGNAEKAEESVAENASQDLQGKIKQSSEEQEVQTKQVNLTQEQKKEQEDLQKFEENGEPLRQAYSLRQGYDVLSQGDRGEENSEQENQAQKSNENCYAELVGFGTKVAANAFCDKLKKQGMTVALKKRISRTSRGKNIYWYQVVTEKFDNKSDLVAFVDIIKDKENLKGVKIIEC